MPITWTNPEVLERLFIATLASFDNKVNIREIATLYGGEMTYDALENRMRKFKKAATALKDEAAGGGDGAGAAKSPVKTRAKKGGGSASPVKGAVKTGRVTKKKAPAAPKIKPEPVFEDEEGIQGLVEEELEAGEEVIDEIEEEV
ncbi:uncharacterized protein J4E88_010927 [Alternaria novae-zelandiae]|uniref:uncharacterized protein n=1 Tax=Alternaria novae-zelandiae TaxID=430562 RepID=UPI0020C5A609|nr:uncharacterized protein J4E88_010927 [Alternaria novae-zelandiae]KAI4662137.1 hypothetical protein J4E88_010927 [Alternaria novae-zelandiae]